MMSLLIKQHIPCLPLQYLNMQRMKVTTAKCQVSRRDMILSSQLWLTRIAPILILRNILTPAFDDSVYLSPHQAKNVSAKNTTLKLSLTPKTTWIHNTQILQRLHKRIVCQIICQSMDMWRSASDFTLLEDAHNWSFTMLYQNNMPACHCAWSLRIWSDSRHTPHSDPIIVAR